MALAIGKIPGTEVSTALTAEPPIKHHGRLRYHYSHIFREIRKSSIYDHRCDVPAPEGSNLGQCRGGLDGDRAVQFGYSPVI